MHLKTKPRNELKSATSNSSFGCELGLSAARVVPGVIASTYDGLGQGASPLSQLLIAIAAKVRVCVTFAWGNSLLRNIHVV